MQLNIHKNKETGKVHSVGRGVERKKEGLNIQILNLNSNSKVFYFSVMVLLKTRVVSAQNNLFPVLIAHKRRQ